MKETLKFLLMLAFLPMLTANGQTKCRHCLAKSINIVFDSSGRMVSFPPAVVRKGDVLQFAVSVPLQVLKNQLTAFTNTLQSDYDTLGAGTTSYDYKFLLAGIDGYKDKLKNTLGNNDYKKLADDLCKKFDSAAFESAIGKDDALHFPINSFIDHLRNKQDEVKIISDGKPAGSFFLPLQEGCKDECVRFSNEGCLKVRSLLCKF